MKRLCHHEWITVIDGYHNSEPDTTWCRECGVLSRPVGMGDEILEPRATELTRLRHELDDNDRRFSDFGIRYEKLERKLEDKSKRLQKRVADIESLTAERNYYLSQLAAVTIWRGFICGVSHQHKEFSKPGALTKLDKILAPGFKCSGCVKLAGGVLKLAKDLDGVKWAIEHWGGKPVSEYIPITKQLFSFIESLDSRLKQAGEAWPIVKRHGLTNVEHGLPEVLKLDTALDGGKEKE